MDCGVAFSSFGILIYASLIIYCLPAGFVMTLRVTLSCYFTLAYQFVSHCLDKKMLSYDSIYLMLGL
jgi:hypothetical protein